MHLQELHAYANGTPVSIINALALGNKSRAIHHLLNMGHGSKSTMFTL